MFPVTEYRPPITTCRPENILYRTNDSESDIVIADFGMFVSGSSALGMPLISLGHSALSISTPPRNSCIRWREVSVTSPPRSSTERGMANPWISGQPGASLPRSLYSGVYRAFSVITYVLLCGYAPFRSEDPKELVRETMAAKIEFHDRYWKNVSQEGATTSRTILLTTHTSAQKYLAKNFIKSLLNPSPTKRPTAADALADHVRIPFPVRPWRSLRYPQWLTIHTPSTETDLPGLRENFNPRARWKSAINSTRALIRLHAGVNASKTNGSNSSVRREIPSDDDDDDDGFPLPTPWKSGTSTSKNLAGGTGPRSGALNASEPSPPLPSSNGVQPPIVDDQAKESPEPPSTQKHPPQPPPVESVVEDTSRMSIQTDDIPMPGSFFRKHHAAQGDGNGQTHLHRWLPRWLQSKRS